MKNLFLCIACVIIFQGCEKSTVYNPEDKNIQIQNLLTDGRWTKLADFEGFARNNATGFSIGNKGYFGTGYFGDPVNDFWEYDLLTNSWEQKADFGGGKRRHSAAFNIGNKGYIFGGVGSLGLEFPFNDLWEYDPELNTWTKKADLPGKGRYQAVGFSIDGNGYIGTGSIVEKVQLKDCLVTEFKQTDEFWQYTSSANTWIKKASFKGGARFEAVGFSIGDNGYLGTGQDSTGRYQKDFWEYNVSSDSWIRKADFGGQERSEAVGFGINSVSRGYIGFGFGFTSPNSTVFGDFFEYDPGSDKWTERGQLSGIFLVNGVSFTTASKGYVVDGLKKEFWEFDPLK